MALANFDEKVFNAEMKLCEDETNSSRFKCVTSTDIDRTVQEAIPQNTLNKSNWAYKIFSDWLIVWRERLDDVLKILKPIEEFSTGDLDYALQYFYMEMRKKSGELYPPQTQKEIVAGIQWYLNRNFNWNISLFNDAAFTQSRKVLDAAMKSAAKQGCVRASKQAEVISMEQERAFWENGCLGSSNPRQLINSLVYLLGLHLSLRASQEHRDLEYGVDGQIQLKTGTDGCEFLEYTERISKNKRFGIKHARMQPKCTRVYANHENLQRCPVSLYKCYLSHRPEANNRPGCSAFYLSVIANPKDNCWYKAIPLGVHTIQEATRSIVSSLGQPGDGFISNTSLRRTAQNRLVQAGVPREIIHKKTGRVSEQADLAYTSATAYEKSMSMILSGNSSSSAASCSVTTHSNQTSCVAKSENTVHIVIENGAKKATIDL